MFSLKIKIVFTINLIDNIEQQTKLKTWIFPINILHLVLKNKVKRCVHRSAKWRQKQTKPNKIKQWQY